MTSPIHLGAALAAALLALFPRIARADAPSSGPLGQISERRLANGMDVVVQEDHRVPLVAMTLRYDVGERAAPAGLSGIASLTASLMLRATKHVGPGEYYRLLSRAGAINVSDTTTVDATFLEVEVPSRQFELPLWLWSDQMGFFAEGLDDAQIDVQRSTLMAKRRARFDGEALSRIPTFAQEEIFPEGHPYHDALPDSPEALRTIDRAAILAFHDAWMTPEHATLSIVGDIVPGDALALVERYFGPVVRPEPSHTVDRPPPVILQGQTLLDVAANVSTARVVLRWPTARYLTTEDAELDILARVLCGGRTSWLYWSLVDQKKIARRISVRQFSQDLGSQFEVNIEAAPGRSAAELLAAFDASMDEVARRQATEGVVTMARYETFVGGFANIESPRFRAQRSATYSALVGMPGYYAHDMERYSRVTPDAVHDAIVKWMPKDRRLAILVTPDHNAPVGGTRTGRRFVPAGVP